MSPITLNSHDVLGKLTVIKNYVSVLLENQTFGEKEKEYLNRIMEATEDLITEIKQKAQEAKSNQASSDESVK